MKKSVAIVGQGFVGGSLTTVFSERGTRVFTYDISGKVADGGEQTTAKSIEQFVKICESNKHFSGIYFVCLPTPMNSDGSCNISIVEGVLSELSQVDGKRIAVNKSTLPPGTIEGWNKKFGDKGLNIIHSPEFLREASALDDQRNQKFIVLGGPVPHINKVRDFLSALFPTVIIHKTSSSNSELMKLFINTFLATKVSFANEFFQICEKLVEQGLKVDYDRIIDLATLDERIGRSHLQVPGTMPADDGSGKLLRGFGGSCFPKDLNALIVVAKELGVDPKVLIASWLKNVEVRPEKDWLNLKGRAVSNDDKIE